MTNIKPTGNVHLQEITKLSVCKQRAVTSVDTNGTDRRCCQFAVHKRHGQALVLVHRAQTARTGAGASSPRRNGTDRRWRQFAVHKRPVSSECGQSQGGPNLFIFLTLLKEERHTHAHTRLFSPS
jgi:hypothetical protein